ncbi:protein similar-like [Culex pipiens pallens]|uniref:protein similar-like n=1 Tax=Culex pipiens pallens TaxID=42434 RepID=UPI001953F5DA|nr:protein similar-like [Culex pipiens pallens]
MYLRLIDLENMHFRRNKTTLHLSLSTVSTRESKIQLRLSPLAGVFFLLYWIEVISKGQSETARYRFLARTGGYAWVVTQATLIYDKQKPHSIVCVNYVISGVENKDEIYSCAQLEARSATEPASSAAEPSVAEPVKKTSSVTKVLAENVNRCNSGGDQTPEAKPEAVVVIVPVGKENPKPEPEVVKVQGPPPPQPLSNSVIASANKPTTNKVSRPVSVTASIFSSAAAKKDTPKPVVGPQSVTAKLFVTLNPTQQPTAAGGCNKPKHATEKIFAPRTEDMNKGFLMFSEEEPGLTMLKDEPDDLTHLAPTAGDTCIPLEETGPFFNDVFDDFMIPESYTSLLQDELNSLDSADQRLSISVSSVASPITINGTTISTISHQTASHSSLSSSSASSITSCSPSSCSVASPSSLSSSSTATNGTSSGISSSGIGSGTSSTTSNSSNHNNNSQSSGASSNDPFINYRDEISEISHSPHLLSPGLSKSPEGSSIPSLCSPNGSGGCPEDELAFMTLNMDDDLDLSMRAPYISMSEVDDLPLLTSDDLMWGAAPVSIVEGSSAKYHLKDEFGHQQQQDSTTAKSQVTTVNVVAHRADQQQQTTNSNTSNNHNIENNCNIGNKIIDSSLAALLCGNVINIQTSTIQLQPASHQQQQQQQQNCSRQQILIQQAQDSIIAADVQQQLQQQQREILGDKKISLVHHPMVVISNGYKNSSNAATPNTIEAWAMGNELLLNGVSQNNSSTTTASTTSTSSNSTGSKLNVIVSKKSASGSSSGSSSTKRSLASSETDGTSKRVKSSGSGAVQHSSSTTSSPQLLQQLMAPSPVPAKAKAKSKLDQSDRWPTGAAGVGSGKQADQVSNSVLMNLLVSGCDTNIPKSPPEILIADDNSCQEIMLKRDELTDEENEDRVLQANPMLAADVPLTVRTDSPPLTQSLSSPPSSQGDDFLMTVSPSLLTASDLELWRAIQQHGLDPKTIRPPVSPGDSAASNLLAVLDPAMAISRLRNVDDDDEQDFEMTIPVNEILQNNLI